MAQIQRLNFKWSFADVDRVVLLARKGWSADEISLELRGTRLESTPREIVNLVADLNIGVHHLGRAAR
jgi:hypothetical protein